jgi:hypothetical protein
MRAVAREPSDPRASTTRPEHLFAVLAGNELLNEPVRLAVVRRTVRCTLARSVIPTLSPERKPVPRTVTGVLSTTRSVAFELEATALEWPAATRASASAPASARFRSIVGPYLVSLFATRVHTRRRPSEGDPMTDRDDLSEEELETEDGELLPDREAMSVLTPPGEVPLPFPEEPGLPPPRD